jgi:orotate phosphoribosyltransferase
MKPDPSSDECARADVAPQLPQLSVMPVVGRARGQLASVLDGRYGSMHPDELQSAIRWLALQTDLTAVDYVLGIPEGGCIPAYAFAVATGLRVVLATIWQPDRPGVVSFCEAHDPPPVTGKHVYGLSSGDHVIVVEDEVTSGRTVVNCVRALRAAGIHCDQVAALYAADDPQMHALLAEEHVRLHAASLYQVHIGQRLYGAQ